VKAPAEEPGRHPVQARPCAVEDRGQRNVQILQPAISSMRRDAGCSRRSASTPSIECLTQAGFAGRGHPPIIRVPGAGTVLPIASGWMMCHDRHPPPLPPSSLPEKTAIRSPRRQRPLYQGSRASTGRLRSASGRHDRSHPVLRHPPTPYLREGCAATAGRGPDGCRGKHAFLGRSVAPREGTGSRFSRSGMVAAHGGCPPMHRST
jgi:hypothetical protein